MELLIIVVALCVLGLLAMRYGYDSQRGLQSKEEQAAAIGMTWDGLDLPGASNARAL